MGSAVPSRASLLISTLRLNLVLTNGIPPEFRGGIHLFMSLTYSILKLRRKRTTYLKQLTELRVIQVSPEYMCIVDLIMRGKPDTLTVKK